MDPHTNAFLKMIIMLLMYGSNAAYRPIVTYMGSGRPEVVPTNKLWRQHVGTTQGPMNDN